MPFIDTPSHYKPASVEGRVSWSLPEELSQSARNLDEFYELVLSSLSEAELHQVAIVMPEHLRQASTPSESSNGASALGLAGLGALGAKTQGSSLPAGRRAFIGKAVLTVGAAAAFFLSGSRRTPSAFAAQNSPNAVCNCYNGTFMNPCDREFRCDLGTIGRRAVFDHYGWDNNCGNTCQSIYRGMICC